jgi:hypothetical protein
MDILNSRLDKALNNNSKKNNVKCCM